LLLFSYSFDVLSFSSFRTIPERRKKGLEKLEEFAETILLGTTIFWEFPYRFQGNVCPEAGGVGQWAACAMAQPPHL